MRGFEYHDLFFSDSGDYAVENGDLKDTVGLERLRSDKQEIKAIVNSQPGDWKLLPRNGAGINRVSGLNNTNSSGRIIESLVLEAILRDDTFNPGDIVITEIPISAHTVFVRVDILCSSEFSEDNFVPVSFIYDINNQSLSAI